MPESGADAGFAFSSPLELLVAIMITTRPYGGLECPPREYATLLALVISQLNLSRVALEQSFWIGVLESAVTDLARAGIWAVAQAYHPGLTFTDTSQEGQPS